MKFKKWLQEKEILEAVSSTSGKVRSSSGDLTNISIGALGPYRAFGHKDRPGVFSTAAASVLDGIGDRMRKEIGDLTAPGRFLSADLHKLFEKDNMVSDVIILQLPWGENIDIPRGSININPSNKKMTFSNVQQYVPDPANDPRVATIQNYNEEGKFTLYTDEFDKQKPPPRFSSYYRLAEEFSTTLSKIKLFNHLNKVASNKIKDIIDIENPKIISQQTFKIGNYYKLSNVYKYERKKTAIGDANIDDSYFDN